MHTITFCRNRSQITSKIIKLKKSLIKEMRIYVLLILLFMYSNHLRTVAVIARFRRILNVQSFRIFYEGNFKKLSLTDIPQTIISLIIFPHNLKIGRFRIKLVKNCVPNFFYSILLYNKTLYCMEYLTLCLCISASSFLLNNFHYLQLKLKMLFTFQTKRKCLKGCRVTENALYTFCCT